MKITLKVWRQKDAKSEGRFVTYEAPDVSPDMSFLEMLDVVNEGLAVKGEDPIAFDHDCREGICGMCGMIINGVAHGPERATTACQLHMRHFRDGDEITIEPWRAQAFPVIKDLVVDRSAFDRIIEAGGDGPPAPEPPPSPPNPREPNNRLSWLLGRLDAAYGDDACYVHLTRDRAQVAASFAKRMEFGIMKAYWEGVLLHEEQPEASALAAANDYIDTVEANIALFLKDKSNTLEFRLETAKEDFRRFWEWIGAAGDLDKAVAEWAVHHNASTET